MTEIHQVKCDHCGEQAKLEKGYMGYYHLPKRWNCSEDTKSDYCPYCYKKFKKCLQRCMLNNVKGLKGGIE